MKHLFEMKEFQGSSEKWYCSDVSDLAHNSGAWYLPARMLGLTPAQYLSKVINEYKPNSVYHNEDCSFVSFSWDKQSDMRKFKLFINKEARNRNFLI